MKILKIEEYLNFEIHFYFPKFILSLHLITYTIINKKYYELNNHM